jgi:NarL family two-component system response regulator LiaR
VEARALAIVDFDLASEERVLAALQRLPNLLVTRGLVSDARLPLRLAQLAPDVVLLNLGHDSDGRIQTVRRAAPWARVVVRVAADDTTEIALQHGANGVIAHDSDTDVLLESIDRVVHGATFLDPRLASRLVRLATRGQRVAGPFGLTLQEMRVLELLARGLTNQQIASELGLGVATVKTHVYNLMRKLRVRNRTEAASVAMRNGLA